MDPMTPTDRGHHSDIALPNVPRYVATGHSTDADLGNADFDCAHDLTHESGRGRPSHADDPANRIFIVVRANDGDYTLR